ncbi:glycosyltransferase family 1 protein [Kutzneria viridogrisea]|uniref:Glycosyltransferase involved in cell wall biosynthesis n=1 Tax=Kutzneria viridogrisea TaxID=47990 RepID=A0ABR6BI17_9PSEU|nr:glycosyltransferase involved in cell wall biosynthesis [Kutzneria viridogrisea]
MPELVVLTEQLLAPVPGGTGRYTRELAAALARTAPPGWTVTGAVARCADPSAAVIPGVAGPRVLALPRRALALAWQRGVPLWPGGDSVHAPTPLSPTTVKRGRGLVVTVHDAVPWTHPETLTPHGARWHRDVISRLTRRAGAIVVPTGAVAAELAEHSPGSAGVHVVGHGVSAAVLEEPAQAGQIARRLDLPPRYVLAVGTLEPRKGIDVLIEAMSLPGAPDLPLLLAGPPGWGEVDVHRLAAARSLSPERVRSLGLLTDAELAVVLRGATVLAAPSLAEGFGLPLLEAMAAGVPVVHSDAPALVEVAGGTGVIARRGDPVALVSALRTVLDDPGRTIAAARERAAGFTWRAAAQAVWQVHLELHRAAHGRLP